MNARFSNTTFIAYKLDVYVRFVSALGIVLVLLLFNVGAAHAQAEGAPSSDAAVAAQSPADFDPLARGEVEPGVLLLGLKPGTSQSDARRMVRERGWTVRHAWPAMNMLAVHVGGEVSASSALDASAIDALNRARVEATALPFVHFADVNGRVYAADMDTARTRRDAEFTFIDPTTPTSDPMVDQQWSLNAIGALDAWTITQGDPSVVVAVIDSGYEHGHEDLNRSVLWSNVNEVNGLPGVDDDGNGYIDDLHGWDWSDDDNTLNDELGHGTHVGGTIAALTDNGIGIAGIGGNLTLMPLRILDSSGNGYISDLISAIDYAHAHGANIANLSLVLYYDSSALHAAIQHAYADGMMIVAAAGNLNRAVQWPAIYDETIAVVATDRNDQRGSFSNFGPEIDVAAPGVDIIGTYGSNSYFSNTGTSMATPHVSALAGLIWSVHPELSIEEVRALMRTTADDVNSNELPGFDNFLGAGRINFEAAVQRAASAIDAQVHYPAASTFFTNQEIEINVELNARNAHGESQGVHGAVISAMLVSLDEMTERVMDALPVDPKTRHTISGQDGTATLSFLLTGFDPGTYLLHVVVADDEPQTKQIDIVAAPAAVRLSAQTTTLTAGNGPLPLTIEVLNAAGERIPTVVPLRVETSSGALVETIDEGRNGPSDATGVSTSQVTAMVAEGIHTAGYYAGEKAGTAVVVATLGNIVASTEFTIVAGSAAEAEWLTQDRNLIADRANAHLDLTLEIRDAYGNPVADETSVHVFASRGSLANETVQTEGGRAAIRYVLGGSSDEPVVVWAIVPGTSLQTRVDLTVLDNHLWLPVVARR